MQKAYLFTLLALFFFLAGSLAVFGAVSPCNVTTLLKIGSSGPEVGCIQSELGVKVDGFFGPLTQNAVVAFQTKNTLTPDGIVGPLTVSKLAAAPVAITNLPLGCTSTVGYSPLTGTKCDSKVAFPAPAPTSTQNTNPNLVGLDEFIAAEAKLGREQGYSEEKIKNMVKTIRETALNSKIDYWKEFDKILEQQAAMQLSQAKPNIFEKIVSGTLAFLGVKPQSAEAAAGTPFGGRITFPDPCDYGVGWVIGLKPPLPPTYVYSLFYAPGTEKYLYFNLPYARYVLGTYSPGTFLECYVIGSCDADGGCVVIPNQGKVLPLVGSSPK